MELYQYILIALGAILVIVLPIIFIKRKKVEKKEYDLPIIFDLLDKDNIESVEYSRNKIVINFKDVTLFDTTQLHEKGAKGISVVGDKVKFYFDGSNELNENIFNQIKNYIEG
jgi:phosphotransferase system IIB component